MNGAACYRVTQGQPKLLRVENTFLRQNKI